MEMCIQCCGRTCCKQHDLDAKLPYRQMAGSLSLLFGLSDLLSDVAVVIYWYVYSNYYWASLMLLAILITNIWSAYKYTGQISPRKATWFLSMVGLLNLRILIRYWEELDHDVHYRKLMDARFVEVLLESIPCAIIQLYVIVLDDDYKMTIIVISCFISVINLAYGLRNWYKFTVVSGESADFVAEMTFDKWYIFLEIFVFFDFIVRGGALALFLTVEEYRPISLFTAPIGLFIMEFLLDVWDNKLAREEGQWLPVFARAFSVGLVSLGSGFMFLLFAERRFVAKFEVGFRYTISVGLFVIYNVHYHDESAEHMGWDVIYPVCFVVALIAMGLMHVGKSPLVREEEAMLMENEENDRVY